jgi:DNA-binding NarL/FixJ family response regulator/tetratricopeptide (TPR) repeat protein
MFEEHSKGRSPGMCQIHSSALRTPSGLGAGGGEGPRAMITSGLVCRDLIGRSLELDFLLARARPGPGRRSAVVVVRGEAGVGKSRLAEEFAAAAKRAGTRAVTVAAREYSDAPYAPVAEVFEALGVRATPDPDGQPADGGDAKLRRFSLFAAQLAACAAAQPHGLAVVVEDVHWADGGTVEVLRFLARRLADEPILIVTTYRPEDVEADSARAGAIAALEREAGERMTLDPLAPEEIDKLLRAVLRDAGRRLGADVLGEIRELSDGRPLLAEELLRGVFERIAREGTERAVVPTSIRAAVRERFASLSADDRDVLLHAAVVGRRFSARFLARLGGFESGAVYRALRRARDLQLVIEEDDEDGNCFAFRHALTREAIYAELLRAEARELHARVAVALANEPALDVAAIAEHTYRARDAEHAVAWNERAGDGAKAAFAHADAARYYERAHEFAREPQQQGDLAESAADAWYATGDVERSAAWLRRAMDALAHDDRVRSARIAIRHARMLWELGQHEASIAATQAVVDRLGDDEPALRFEAEVTLAGLLNARTQGTDALEHLVVAEPLLDHADTHWVMRFHGVYGYCLGLLGRGAEARARFVTTIALAREHGEDDVLLRTLNNHGNMELKMGKVAAARGFYDEALAVAERTKNLRIVSWVSQNAALSALVAGDVAAAQRHLARSESVEHRIPIIHRYTCAIALRIAVLTGAARDAERREAAAAFDAALAARDEQSTAILGGALVHDALADGRTAAAEEIVGRAFAAVELIDTPYWIFAAAGRCDDPEARGRARAALAGAAEHDDAAPARGLLALADAREALRRRKRDEATRLAETAAELLRGAGWALDEAEALEVAGRVADAVAILRRAGATAEVRRLTETESAAPRRRGDATLTPREREIIGMVLAGRTARAIADALVISERTVETHIASAYRKLGVSNRTELAALVGQSEPVST